MDNLRSDYNTSITKIDNNMIVTLAGEMIDDDIIRIKKNVTFKAHEKDLSGAIINFTAVPVLDSFALLAFEKMTKELTIMGVKVVWVGLSAGVVTALMDLNLAVNLDSINTALNLEVGLELLSNMKG